MNANLRKTILITVMLTFSLMNLAQAANSASMPVACSIPAVPGLNAPLNEGQATLETATQLQANEEATAPRENEGKEIILTDGSTTRTVYTR